MTREKADAKGIAWFDLYLGQAGKQRYLSTTKFATTAEAFETTLFNGAKENHHFTLNFPLYNGVESVEIGVVAGSTISPPERYGNKGRIGVYGTSRGFSNRNSREL